MIRTIEEQILKSKNDGTRVMKVGVGVMVEIRKDLALTRNSTDPKTWFGMDLIVDPSLAPNQFKIDLKETVL